MMAKWNDPVEQIRAHRQEERESIAMVMARRELDKIPFVGTALDFIRGGEKQKREDFIDNAILDVLKDHEISLETISEKLKSEHMLQVIAAAAERVFWGASEKKAKRFAAVVANSIERAEQEQDFQDAASFIRAIDELSEDDMKVLKHIYNYQKDVVVDGRKIGYNDVFYEDKMVNMLAEAKDLNMQMDEFYSRCSRLVGYGLALPLATTHGSMGNPDDHAFRMTLLGKRLIEILVNIGGESTEVILGRGEAIPTAGE